MLLLTVQVGLHCNFAHIKMLKVEWIAIAVTVECLIVDQTDNDSRVQKIVFRDSRLDNSVES